jgi:hypothetical protein
MQMINLIHCFVNVGRIRIGHRLHHNWVTATNGNIANVYGD